MHLHRVQVFRLGICICVATGCQLVPLPPTHGRGRSVMPACAMTRRAQQRAPSPCSELLQAQMSKGLHAVIAHLHDWLLDYCIIARLFKRPCSSTDTDYRSS